MAMRIFSNKKSSAGAAPAKQKKVSLFERYRNGQPGETSEKKAREQDAAIVKQNPSNPTGSINKHEPLKQSQTCDNMKDTPASFGEGFGLASAPLPSTGLGKSTVPGGTGLIGYLSR